MCVGYKSVSEPEAANYSTAATLHWNITFPDSEKSSLTVHHMRFTHCCSAYGSYSVHFTVILAVAVSLATAENERRNV